MSREYFKGQREEQRAYSRAVEGAGWYDRLSGGHWRAG